VETEPGRGAIFHIYLPAVSIAADKTAIKMDSAVGGPRILIMDDEAAVVGVAANFLSTLGYRVDSAENGDAAIAAYMDARENDDPYAAIILDLTIFTSYGFVEVLPKPYKLDEIKDVLEELGL
jgi:response regulator RpfG family c-di-GMP phosphodiesterase